MNIQNIDSTTFNSRNKTIRVADNIARKANSLYGTVSSSKMLCYKKFKEYKYLQSYILIKTSFMRQMKDRLYNSSRNFYNKIEALINPVRLYKIANCGEKTHLACIMSKLNGIKDCHIAHLFKSDGKDLDHAVLFVNDKNPYIIDSWLGFADYVPNTLTKYKKEYKHFFDIDDSDTLVFCTKCDDEFTIFLKKDFTKKQKKEIKKIFPEMCK